MSREALPRPLQSTPENLLQILNQELHGCRRKIQTCLRDLHDVEAECVDRMVDGFIDGLRTDLQAIRRERHSYLDGMLDWSQADLSAYDTLGPACLGQNETLAAQHLPLCADPHIPAMIGDDTPLSNHDGLDSSEVHGSGGQLESHVLNAGRYLVRSTSRPLESSALLYGGDHDIHPLTQETVISSSSRDSTVADNLFTNDMSVEGLTEAPTDDVGMDQRNQLTKWMGQNCDNIASEETLRNFRLVICHIRENQCLDLPAAGSEISSVWAFLEKTQNAKNALDLYNRMGLWRFHQAYQSVQMTLKGKRTKMRASERRKTRTGKCASRALDILMKDENTAKNNFHYRARPDYEQYVRARLHARVSASRSWAVLFDSIPTGILALLPSMPSSCFERLRISIVLEFVENLRATHGSNIWQLAGLLSSHLEAILEGQECCLQNIVEGTSLNSWQNIFTFKHELSTCPHAASTSIRSPISDPNPPSQAR